MNRITKRCSNGHAVCSYEKYPFSAIQKLASYEDIGMEPEEIKELVHDSYGPLHKKLGEWIDAEKQERLFVLPCKVGDTLYAPTRDFVSEFRVSQFDYCGYGTRYLWVEWYLTKGITGNFRNDGIGASEIGKSVFLTREEAEAELRKGDKWKD